MSGIAPLAKDAPATVVIGSGKQRYSYTRDWAKLPRGWLFRDADPKARPVRIVSTGAVAANGEVLVVSRSKHPVVVFDPQGNFITSWGEGEFSSFVHGLAIAPDGRVWITDSGYHEVTVHEPNGDLVRRMGSRHEPAPAFVGKPFNMPTDVAFARSGDVYVTDGYGNHRVHCYGADGELKFSWGEPGKGPGQFALVHLPAIDREDNIWITDRENDRIQVFDPKGKFLSEWTGFTKPSDLAFGREHIYVGGGDGLSIWTMDRKPVARWGRDDPYPGAFHIHGIWLDAEENIYIAQFDHMVSKLTRLS